MVFVGQKIIGSVLEYGERKDENLLNEDAKEIVPIIAALRELGNMARHPLADYVDGESMS